MTSLAVRAADGCAYDIVSLGEIMLRLDPGEHRVRTARTFHAWEGGGEYNVARGLRRCFGQRAAVVTALVDNDIGRLIEELVLAGGVDTRFIRWREDDGVGRVVRNGLNFTERGHGVRGARGTSDRGNTAASQMRPGDVDFDQLFGELGVRWFHTGGIYAALSETSFAVVREALVAAKRHGTITSYDLNYRPSLWRSQGGPEAAVARNRELVQYVDVLFGNEEDFGAGLGIRADGPAQFLTNDTFSAVADQISSEFAGVSVVAVTLRTVHSASVNDWGAAAWAADGQLARATMRERMEIFDRVGGGDSFASGMIFGLLDGADLKTAVELGAAHGALAMTTPGDASSARLDEVRRLAAGADARVQR